MVFWGCVILFLILVIINIFCSCKLAKESDEKSEKVFKKYIDDENT